jgi:hypothetical protein
VPRPWPISTAQSSSCHFDDGSLLCPRAAMCCMFLWRRVGIRTQAERTPSPRRQVRQCRTNPPDYLAGAVDRMFGQAQKSTNRLIERIPVRPGIVPCAEKHRSPHRGSILTAVPCQTAIARPVPASATPPLPFMGCRDFSHHASDAAVPTNP